MTAEERAEEVLAAMHQMNLIEYDGNSKQSRLDWDARIALIVTEIKEAEQTAIKECADIAQEFHATECDYEKCNLKCLPNRIAQKIREQVKK